VQERPGLIWSCYLLCATVAGGPLFVQTRRTVSFKLSRFEKVICDAGPFIFLLRASPKRLSLSRIVTRNCSVSLLVTHQKNLLFHIPSQDGSGSFYCREIATVIQLFLDSIQILTAIERSALEESRMGWSLVFATTNPKPKYSLKMPSERKPKRREPMVAEDQWPEAKKQLHPWPPNNLF